MRIPDKITGAFATAKAFNELRDVVQWLARYAIVTIAAPLEAKALGQGRALGLAQDSENTYFNAVIGGSTSAGPNKWTYNFTEVQKISGGYSGFSAVTNGRTGTAYNMAEYINSATGLQGNGVVVENLATVPGEYTIQPCPPGTPVVMQAITRTDGVTEYWFSHTNGIDGVCE
jgi:hypothetical protein